MPESTLSPVEAARQRLIGGSGINDAELLKAQTRYENNQSILSKLGSIPRAGVGILARAVAPLDYLGGVVRSGIMSGMNLAYKAAGVEDNLIDINRDGDTSNDLNPFDNILKRAILKNPFDANQRVAGFGDVPALRFEDDSPFWQRQWHTITNPTRLGQSIAGGFLDIGTDPLTYLTAGFGPVAKAVGLKAVTTKTAAEAGEILAKETSRKAAVTILKDSDRIATLAADTFPELARTSKSKAVGRFLGSLPKEQLAREAADEVAYRATAVFRGPGKRSLRQYFEQLAKETGVDEFGGLYNKQIDEVRGGFRFTTPSGKTIKRLTPGGISPIEAVRSPMFARLGGTKVGQTLTLGAERELQQATKRAAAELVSQETKGLSRILTKAAATEGQLAAVRAGNKAARGASSQIAREAQELVANYQEAVSRVEASNVGDGLLFKEKVNRYIQEFDLPESKRSFTDEGLRVAGSELDEEALRYAKSFVNLDNGTYLANKAKLGKLFSDSGYIEGPRRVLTVEAEKFVKQERGVVSGARSTGKFKSREDFWLIDPDTGARRWMTIDEANQAVRQDLLRRGFSEEQIPAKWFETDAETIFVRSMDKMARKVEKVSPIKSLRDKGFLVESDRVGGLNPREVEKKAQERIEKLTRQAEREVSASPEAAAGILTDAARLQTAVEEAWTKSGAEQNEAFGVILNQIWDLDERDLKQLIGSFAANTDRGKQVRAAYERLKKARLENDDKPLAALMRDKTRLGSIQNKGKTIEIETEFMNLWADNELAVALTNYAKVRQDLGPIARNMEAILSAWRRSATVGRGPAFVLRNLGTWWNAFLVGAGRRDFKDGFRYMAIRESAIRDYMKRLATESPDDLIKYVDGERLNLLDQIFQEKMTGKTIGGMDMWEAHKAMEREGIFGGTLTSTAIARDENNTPEQITARSIIGRGRSSVFSRTERGAVQEIRPDKWLTRDSLMELAQNARAARKAGELRPISRAIDASVNNPWFYGISFLSENSEVFLRASTFSAGLRRYGSDATAAELSGLLVKATQFDYQDMSDFERKYVRQIAPFYIWTKNNVPFQFRNLFANPGKVNMALRSLEKIQDSIGQEEDSYYNQYLPGWVKEQMGFASTMRSGDNPLALSLNLPLADLNRYVVIPDSLPTSPTAARQMLGAVVSGTRDDAVGSLNPFIKTGIESITGTSTFTGSKFTDQPAGPIYSLLSVLPGIPDTYIDPETGQRMTSGFGQSQVRNLLPIVGQGDRLIPFGQQGNNKERVFGNWMSQLTSGLPVSVSATVTNSQMTGELKSRNRDLEQIIKLEARKRGLTTDEIRDQFEQDQKIAQMFRSPAKDDTVLSNAITRIDRNRKRALAAALST